MKILLIVSLISLVLSQDIQWRKCTEFTGSSNHLCARVKVPFDYSKPSGDQIEVFISKAKTTNNPKGIVWAFHGGPSEGDFEAVITYALPLFKDYEVYAVLQRGGKFGTPLSCPESSRGGKKKLFTFFLVDKKCIEFVNEKWGDNLKHFSTSSAARDVDHLMKLTTDNSSLPLYLYGVSYGSWYLNRFLTMFGEKRKYSAAVFDSVFDSKVGQFQHSQYNYDAAINMLFNDCDKDTFCGTTFSNHFHGKSAKRILQETVVNIQERKTIYKCIQEITGIQDPKPINFKTLLVKGLDTRAIFPALLFKLNRCSQTDINQLKRIKPFFEEMDYSFWPGGAFVANIYMSEMYRQPNSELLSKETLQQQEESLLSIPINSIIGIDLYNNWKRYPIDEYTYKYPTSKIPTLVILGDDDEATPLQWGMSYAKNTNAHLYRLPRTGHWGSLNRRCIKLVNEFFSSNGRLIDEGCKESVPENDFEGKTEAMKRLYNAVFGTPEPWK